MQTITEIFITCQTQQEQNMLTTKCVLRYGKQWRLVRLLHSTIATGVETKYYALFDTNVVPDSVNVMLTAATGNLKSKIEEINMKIPAMCEYHCVTKCQFCHEWMTCPGRASPLAQCHLG